MTAHTYPGDPCTEEDILATSIIFVKHEAVLYKLHTATVDQGEASIHQCFFATSRHGLVDPYINDSPQAWGRLWMNQDVPQPVADRFQDQADRHACS